MSHGTTAAGVNEQLQLATVFQLIRVQDKQITVDNIEKGKGHDQIKLNTMRDQKTS